MKSTAKWFVVMKPSTGEIIAISANQIVPPKFRQRSVNVVLYSPDPLSSWRVEGESGFETSDTAELIAEIPKHQLIAQLLLNNVALCQLYIIKLYRPMYNSDWYTRNTLLQASAHFPFPLVWYCLQFFWLQNTNTVIVKVGRLW